MTIQELVAEYSLGDEARIFIESELGQYLAGCADAEIESYRNKLETVEATDDKAIRQMQTEIASRKHAFRWLVDCINAGKLAGENLEQIEVED